jgi:hypothetical protein
VRGRAGGGRRAGEGSVGGRGVRLQGSELLDSVLEFVKIRRRCFFMLRRFACGGWGRKYSGLVL